MFGNICNEALSSLGSLEQDSRNGLQSRTYVPFKFPLHVLDGRPAVWKLDQGRIDHHPPEGRAEWGHLSSQSLFPDSLSLGSQGLIASTMGRPCPLSPRLWATLSSHTLSTAPVPGHWLGPSEYLSCPAVSHSCSAKFLLSTTRVLVRKSTPRTHRERREGFYSPCRTASPRCHKCVPTPNPSHRRMEPHAGLLSALERSPRDQVSHLQAAFPRCRKDPWGHTVCSGTLGLWGESPSARPYLKDP